jgi:hypothetical protein
MISAPGVWRCLDPWSGATLFFAVGIPSYPSAPPHSAECSLKGGLHHSSPAANGLSHTINLRATYDPMGQRARMAP